jgi:2',3'-cyclic-nucleotide 2'-phosphodiesterase (5'-nucleotidase family)
MIRSLWRVVLSCFLVLTVSLGAATRRTSLTILHTNDTHSTLFPFGPLDDWGGIARMSEKIKELRSKSENVLVLNAGDVFVGTFEFNKYLGYPELKIMEGLYDAMCLGNHEFDLGTDALLGVLSGQIGGGQPVGLPLLCANMDLEGLPALKSFVKPYVVERVGGLKVGLIGVVNTDAMNYSPEVFSLLTDPFQAAGQAAYALRNVEGADVVICLSHLGKMYDVAGLSQVPGIDIIVGGHSHDALENAIVANGKIIVQAGEFGRFLGRLVVEVADGRVSLVSDRLYPIDGRVRKDPALLPMLNALRVGIVADPRFGQVYDGLVAIAPWNLEEKWDLARPERDTALGNLVADAIRKRVNDAGFPADIALEANGYIAAAIIKGKVVGNDIMRSVPYGYDPVSGLGFKLDSVLLLGAQILAGLEYSVSTVEYADDTAMQASGLTFRYDSNKTPMAPDQLIQNLMSGIPEFGRVDPFSIRINGQPIDFMGTYWVALNEQLHRFLLSQKLEPLAEMSTGVFEYSAVREFMAARRLLDYGIEGRVIDTSVR